MLGQLPDVSGCKQGSGVGWQGAGVTDQGCGCLGAQVRPQTWGRFGSESLSQRRGDTPNIRRITSLWQRCSYFNFSSFNKYSRPSQKGCLIA